MIKRFLKWWNKPSQFQKVVQRLEARPECIEISFTYKNGRQQRLVGQEATDYFKYLWMLYHGYTSSLNAMHERKWQWQEKDEPEV